MCADNRINVLRDMRAGPSRYFEDFELGEIFYIPSRTLTDALFAAFQLACINLRRLLVSMHTCYRVQISSAATLNRSAVAGKPPTSSA